MLPTDAAGEMSPQAAKDSADDPVRQAFAQMEAVGGLLRLDEGVWPEKFKCATVNKEEYHRLQEVENVVRMGRESRAAGWPSRPG